MKGTKKKMRGILATLQAVATEVMNRKKEQIQVTELMETITRLQADVKILENDIREMRENDLEEKLNLIKSMKSIMQAVGIEQVQTEKVEELSLAEDRGKPLEEMEMQEFIEAVEEQHSGESMDVKKGALGVSKNFRDSAMYV